MLRGTKHLDSVGEQKDKRSFPAVRMTREKDISMMQYTLCHAERNEASRTACAFLVLWGLQPQSFAIRI